MDHGAIVVGAGHNGLICAAYLARAGIDTLVVEARPTVGGCASTVDALGARVNICNCDHVVFRTTPIIDELDLARHGLRYLDVDPAQLNVSWAGGPAWPIFHDLDRTLSALARLHPTEVEGYRRYVRAARPVAELILEVACEPPTPGGILRKVADRRARGVATLLAWSRRSAAEVLRSFFHHEALLGPVVTTGPAVWGLPPSFPGTGVGAIGYAMKHVATVGRPEGGSGMVPDTVLASFEEAGGKVRTSSEVTAVLCEGERVRGVELADGTVIEAPLVVVASDPRRAIVGWLRNPPAAADRLVARWRAAAQHEGYESKIDAVVTELPRFRSIDETVLAELGVERPLEATVVVAPALADIEQAHRLAAQGEVAARPMFLCNVPSVLDPTMAVPGPDGGHVFSLEVLFTPYGLTGGWDGSGEPARWLHVFGRLVQPGWGASVRRWRAMTPPAYERDFHMPKGYATSFAGGPLAALLGREPERTRYRTPIEGLWLTGAATFPGAGVWGAAGRNAALAILRSR